jgi:hypothetical protein
VTTYYADYVNGNDANNGLGPDASAVTNKPFKTITKLLGASGVMVSGDTAYLAPGSFRELVTAGITSPVAETKIIGDPQNLRGFKTAGGTLVAPNPVIWTCYLTNDSTAPNTGNLLDLSGRDFLTFRNIQFVAIGTAIQFSFTVPTNITFTDCAFIGVGTGANNALINLQINSAVAWHWLFERCSFSGFNNGANRNIAIQATKHASADYDIDVVFKNCLLWCGIYVTTNGGSTFKPGGILLYNCTCIQVGGANIFYVDTTDFSTTIPCKVENCIMVTQGNALQAQTTGEIVEDYNLIYAGTARVNVATGTHSSSDRAIAPLLNLGQDHIWDKRLRPWGSIQQQATALLAFGASANVQATDKDANPRPSGGLSQPGAYVSGNTWTAQTATVRSGSFALACTGPGYQDFDLAVDAASTTVSVYLRYDSTYAGTKPLMQVLNGAECGVADASTSAVTTVNTWEQKTLTFTPSQKGIVTIRLWSQDTNGGGKAFADDWAVA